MKIILASGSPRRRELLQQAGYTFKVMVSQADENVEIENPVEMVEELSARKAEAVAKELAVDPNKGEEGYLVIGADTIVVYQDQILGKPSDEEDGIHMMRALSGQTHQVYTGVAFYKVAGHEMIPLRRIHERTDVIIREMSEEEILAYIKGCDDWRDKAGGYGIQTAFGAKFIPGIQGDYYNVVGLPACKVGQCIQEIQDRFF